MNNQSWKSINPLIMIQTVAMWDSSRDVDLSRLGDVVTNLSTNQFKQTHTMRSNNHEHFEEIAIEHNFMTYYACGYVEYITTTSIGGSYEGYDFETLYDREISDITLTDLWYFDEDTGNAVEILNHEAYKEIEEIAQDAIRYEFE